MTKNTMIAALCVAFTLASVPAIAAPQEMPQGKRDEMSMKDTKKQVNAQKKENKEANKNVDSLINNRKWGVGKTASYHLKDYDKVHRAG
ncbi:hypothetical protein [Methylobacterium sp. GXS13]|uniref:hypothetical protein n=1 Tax=Methylobacterium sp. GXS13 TaxID=1730094 RepID=UPI000A796A4A|nr:hypothetical protein [Methylobacterium sp. GXS13]